MKRKIKDYAIIAAVFVGFFLPFVLVALGFAFSWTIAIVAGIVCEIGVFFIFLGIVWCFHNLRITVNVNIAEKENKEDSK